MLGWRFIAGDVVVRDTGRDGDAIRIDHGREGGCVRLVS